MEQEKFKFEKVPINEKDKIIIQRKGGEYVISLVNEVGFETLPIPEGTKIRVEGYRIGIGTDMPETTGQVFYENGKPYYHAIRDGIVKNGRYDLRFKFQDEEIIEILELPKT